jgi:MoaE-MoaD fusion protein
VEVTVRYFAMVRDVMGRSVETRRVPPATTVGGLVEALVAEEPRLGPMRGATMVMVNQAYVPAGHELAPGDEVALIPPVSGGERRFRIQEEPLDPRAVEALVEDPASGAMVTFVGRVRDNARGKGVDLLEYEAYPAAAERMMAQIAEEITDRWGTDRVAITHRTGRLGVGEASVVIAVAAPHRAEAFAACQYAIERLKEIVPIWKKEHYADGAVWIGSEAEYRAAGTS